MSSKLLEYLLKNVGKLTFTDLLLLGVTALLVGVALFAIFRWLYDARFKAQHDLLEIKEETIGSLRARLQDLASQFDVSQRYLETTERHLERVKSEYESIQRNTEEGASPILS